jgi:hypothetical protein
MRAGGKAGDGFVECLAKPVDLEKLFAVIARYCG